jgi:hypothetical protein
MRTRLGQLETRVQLAERRVAKADGATCERIQRMTRDEVIAHLRKLLPLLPKDYPSRALSMFLANASKCETEVYRNTLAEASRAHSRWAEGRSQERSKGPGAWVGDARPPD